MENLAAIGDVPQTSATFFSYVFNFDTDTKNQLLNLAQYILLAIIPIVLLNKSVQYIFPESDETATTWTLLGEITGQLVYIFVALVFINRVLTYIPTYSKIGYTEMNLASVILPFLVIILSLQTKVGQKVEILAQRAKKAYGGKSDATSKGEETQGPPQAVPTHQPSRADYVTTHQGLVSPQDARYAPGSEGGVIAQTGRDAEARTAQRTSPNFNSFYTSGPGGDYIEPMSMGGSSYAAF